MHVYISEGETAIEGTVPEMRNVSECINRARVGFIKSYTLSQLATAEPYNELLEELILDCNGSKIKGSLHGKSLKLEFSEETAEIMASYFEFEEDFIHNNHYHFDKYGNEDYFEEESIDMIVQVTRKTHNQLLKATPKNGAP